MCLHDAHAVHTRATSLHCVPTHAYACSYRLQPCGQSCRSSNRPQVQNSTRPTCASVSQSAFLSQVWGGPMHSASASFQPCIEEARVAAGVDRTLRCRHQLTSACAHTTPYSHSAHSSLCSTHAADPTAPVLQLARVKNSTHPVTAVSQHSTIRHCTYATDRWAVKARPSPRHPRQPALQAPAPAHQPHRVKRIRVPARPLLQARPLRHLSNFWPHRPVRLHLWDQGQCGHSGKFGCCQSVPGQQQQQ